MLKHFFISEKVNNLSLHAVFIKVSLTYTDMLAARSQMLNPNLQSFHSKSWSHELSLF